MNYCVIIVLIGLVMTVYVVYAIVIIATTQIKTICVNVVKINPKKKKLALISGI